jgi:cytosine deaminase
VLDLIVRRARLADGRANLDIAVAADRIVAVEPAVAARAACEIDAAGRLVTAPFVDSHFHLDSTLTLGRPRRNRSGTLLEGIALWGELAPTLDYDDFCARARTLCRWAIGRGTLAIRSHVDISDPGLVAVEALLAVRREMHPYLDLQLVAFPQQGFLRHAGARTQLIRALDLGVDVVGGIPHFERTTLDGAAAVRELCTLAAERGLPVDMHCDETDDPNSRFVEYLAAETCRLGLTGRVTGSHLSSLGSMDNAYAAKLLDLMAEVGLHVVANPLINLTLQGRFDSYPKRRGLTRIKELLARGLVVALGHDCVMDPWYPLGSQDMLEVAHMAVHAAQMTGVAEMEAMFAAVTTAGARVLGLSDYGIAPGARADFVVLQAADPIEAIRLRSARLWVVRGGRVIAHTPPVETRLMLDGGESVTDYTQITLADCASSPPVAPGE